MWFDVTCWVPLLLRVHRPHVGRLRAVEESWIYELDVREGGEGGGCWVRSGGLSPQGEDRKERHRLHASLPCSNHQSGGRRLWQVKGAARPSRETSKE